MNPNGILPFYYYGYEIDISPKDDGTVCFSRMNYGLTEACLEGEPITEHVKGISVIEKKSYVLEAKIGWEVITEIPQFASFTPTSAPTSFSLCYSNFQKRADEDGGDYNIGACRYGKNFVNAQDMFVQSFNLELDVTAEKAPSLPFIYIYCGIAGAVAIAAVVLIVIKTTKKKQG